MTAITSESRRVQPTTLNGLSTYDSTASTPDLTRAEARAVLERVLPRLAEESTPADAEDGYYVQSRFVNAALDRGVNRWYVRDALSELRRLDLLRAGNCLVELEGVPNTEDNRDAWIDYREEMYRVALNNLTAGIPE